MALLDQFGLTINVPFVRVTSPSYRPPTWPPPRDWVCIEDAEGNTVARWGDSVWPLYPWVGKPMCLNFGDGPSLGGTTPIDRDNADLLRRLVTWRGWGPRGARTAHTLRNNFFTPVRAIIALCSREGILASDLMRFPAVRSKIPEVLAPSFYNKAVSELQRVLDAKEELGFILLDQNGLRQLVAAKPEHNQGQTEYIPPRIWTYQVERLRECLLDYLAHSKLIEDCFHFCVDAYETNQSSHKGTNSKKRQRQPFGTKGKQTGAKSGSEFHGHFRHTAIRFGINEVLGRLVGEPTEGNSTKGISVFRHYLSFVADVALVYVLNFSLMRYEEGRSLRSDCLYTEEDEKLGTIPILCGETTKTDPDSDARWPTNPSIEIAIEVAKSIACLRMRCAKENPIVAPSTNDISNPYLFHRCFEPWGSKPQLYSIRPCRRDYARFVNKYSKLFDNKALTITEEDLCIARSVTPNLNPEVFQIGRPWRFTYHQLRRTGAVNMFSSGIVSDSTVQFQMKHLTRPMSIYYGRGHSALNLNDEVRSLLVNAQYEAMGREIAAVLSDRFVSPYGDDHKRTMMTDVCSQEEVNLLSEEDAKRFEAAARRGAISFRATVLGGCMSKEQCNGDCIESIADCAGGDGGPLCKDALFDKHRAQANQKLLNSIKHQIESTPHASPRYRALEQEKRGLENYFAFIK